MTGTGEVFVVSFPEKRAIIPVASGGGAEPRWSRDGTELFFRNGNTILSVRTRTTPTFEVAGAVQHLFTAAYDFSSSFNWDILPEGRFVMVKSSAEAPPERASDWRLGLVAVLLLLLFAWFAARRSARAHKP